MGEGHRRSSFIHSMTAQLKWVTPDEGDCTCGGANTSDGDRAGGVRGGSGGLVFALESLIVASWTLGSTQCSNIRMFIKAK